MLEKRRRTARDRFCERIGVVGMSDPGAYQGASGSDAGTRKQLSVIAGASFRRFRPSQASYALQLLFEEPGPVEWLCPAPAACYATPAHPGVDIPETSRTTFVNCSCFAQGQRVIARHSHGCFRIASVPCPREN